MSSMGLSVLSGCIEEKEDSVLLHLEVKPGSRKAKIEGINEWRENITVRLKAKAVKGRANKELINLFSSLLDIPSIYVQIIKGKKTRQKTVEISKITRMELENVIIKAIS